MASGGRDKLVKLWSIESHKVLSDFKEHGNMVYSVAFSPNGRYLASGSDDKTIKLWSIESKTELATLRGHTSAVYCVAF